MSNKRFSLGLCILALCAGSLPVCAQWVTQTVNLKSGWNAVYLHVDPSHITLDDLVKVDESNPIIEVWLWAPPVSTLQYVQSPQQPVEGAQWLCWNRNLSSEQALQRLAPNAAYLVRVATNVASFSWTLKGKAVPPAYLWTTTGLNFLGFPTVPVNQPTFDVMIARAPALQNAEIYWYPGGELGVGNPARLYALRNNKVNRGQAYWIRSGTAFNQFFAPFEIKLSGSSGVAFGDTLNASSFRVKNQANTNLVLTLRLLASETAPPGQTNDVGAPPLLVRGTLNTTNLTFSYADLGVNGTYSWTLSADGLAGSEIEIVLGLDRVAMGGQIGDKFSGILRLTDSLGFAQVDLPVSAQTASSAGLWVGQASVTQVGQYLKSYSRDETGSALADTNGQYVATSLNTNIGVVPRSFPLRLIVHNPEVGGGNAVLLQRAFVGVDAWTNPVVALQESALNTAFLKQARRISAAHLPWSLTNACWSFDGAFGQATNLSTTVTLDSDDQASNPFLHTYHPDHDNLDLTFKNQVAQGAESYTVQRNIRLTVVPSIGGSSTFSTSGKSIGGLYAETITVYGLARAGGAFDQRVFEVRGTFVINRISSIATLARP